jgi:hypothetical protein
MADLRLAQSLLNVDSYDSAQEIDLAQSALNADVDNVAQEIRLAQAALQTDARVPPAYSADEHVHFYVYDRYQHPITILDNVVSASFRIELNETGAGDLQLLADEKISLLRPWHIIRVRYREIDVFAFYIEQIERQPVGSDRFVTVRGRGLLSGLERGIVYDETRETVTYENTYLGAILYDLLQQFHERGGSDLVPTFSATEDSSRRPWTISASLEYRRGANLLSTAQNLISYGLELRVDPDHTINAYERLGEDRSSSVLFEEGKNVTSITRKEDATRQANVVYAQGRNHSLKVQNLVNRVRDGVREVFLPVDNALSPLQVQRAAERYLELYRDPTDSLELEISTHDYIPFISYNIGDWVKVRTLYWQGDYRIVALDFVIQEGILTNIRITCNSVQKERQVRLEQAWRLFEGFLASTHSSGLTHRDPRRVAYFEEMGPVSALADVEIILPRANEEVLVYTNSDQKWRNRDLSEIGGGMSQEQADARYVNVTGDTMTGALEIKRGTANDAALKGSVESETIERFLVKANGALSWGDGTNAHDVSLYRLAAGKLKTDDLEVNALTAQSAVANSINTNTLTASNATIATLSGTDAQITRLGVNTAIDATYSLTVGSGAIGAILLPAGTTGRLSWGDVSFYRYASSTVALLGNMFALNNIGIGAVPASTYRLIVGPGTNGAVQLSGTAGTAATGIYFGVDTNLYRKAAGILCTDHRLAAISGLGVGTTAPATHVESEQTVSITSTTADGYAAAITIEPRYTAVSSQTVTRHNYLSILNPITTNVNVTDACLFRFDGNPGTHKALAAGTTKSNMSSVNAWLKVNVNGTIYYIPAYLSTT